KKALLLAVLSFSAQLLENSSEGWEVYDSTKVSAAQLTTGRSDILTLVCSFPQHLIWLLCSTDLRVVAMALKVLSNRTNKCGHFASYDNIEPFRQYVVPLAACLKKEESCTSLMQL